jgi:hypothetical protein
MSEFVAISLVLGIVGTFTGGFALLVSGLTYYYDKPRLSVEVKRFEHTQIGNMITDFYIVLDVKNFGNRSTTLNELELNFSDNGKDFTAKEPLQEKFYTDPLRDMVKVDVEAGKTIQRSLFFHYTNFLLKELREEIPCQLKLYHTHKAVEFRAISKRVPK